MATRKQWALWLAVLLLFPTITGCAGDSTETTAGTLDTAVQTEPADTEPVRYAADLPSRDFDGETFSFYARMYEGAWTVTDLLVSELTGEMINDALYERQLYMEETYNLQLTAVESMNDDILASVKTFVSAGDTAYQAIVGRVYNLADLSLENMVLDLYDVENLDLSQSWWGQTMNESVSICGKQFYAVGDLFIVDNKAERIYYFNKDLAADLGIGNLYAVAREGNWTIDTFMECNEIAAADLNGDGIMTRDTDRYGTMAQPQHLGFGLYLGAGQTIIGKDKDDVPYFHAAEQDALDIMLLIMDKIGARNAISCSNDATMSTIIPDNLIYFQEGRVLFSPEVLMHIESMRDCDVDIGILPNPKLTPEQKEYYCYADGYCVNAVCVPVTNTESEKIGFVLEAMAAESCNNLTPAYFEVCLTDKYVRDTDSVEMLELVMSSAILDLGEVFRWNSIADTISNALYKGEAIASTITATEKAIASSIEKTLNAIDAAE